MSGAQELLELGNLAEWAHKHFFLSPSFKGKTYTAWPNHG